MAIDANNLKQKINQSTILSDSEKKDWLFLLPKMREEQLLELDKILSVQVPTSTTQEPSPTTPAAFAASPPRTGGGEFSTAIHPSVIHPHTTPPMADGEGVHGDATPPVKQKETEVRRPILASLPKEDEAIPERSSRPDFTSELAMTTLSTEAMRKAPSVYEFFDDLAARMILKIRNHETTAQEVIASFQASPLYKAYIKTGIEFLSNTNALSRSEPTGSTTGAWGRDPEALTRSEFEAVADFRTSLKKILQGGT